jgi:hypothetical protein
MRLSESGECADCAPPLSRTFHAVCGKREARHSPPCVRVCVLQLFFHTHTTHISLSSADLAFLHTPGSILHAACNNSDVGAADTLLALSALMALGDIYCAVITQNNNSLSPIVILLFTKKERAHKQQQQPVAWPAFIQIRVRSVKFKLFSY